MSRELVHEGGAPSIDPATRARRAEATKQAEGYATELRKLKERLARAQSEGDSKKEIARIEKLLAGVRQQFLHAMERENN